MSLCGENDEECSRQKKIRLNLEVYLTGHHFAIMRFFKWFDSYSSL